MKLKIKWKTRNKNEIFSFLLKQNDEQSPMPKISKVQITGTKKDAFQIQYEKPGVYRYTISQVAGDGKNWIYDQSEYSLEVYIMRNEQNRYATVTYYRISMQKARKLIHVFMKQIIGHGGQTKKYDGQDRGQRRYKNSGRSDVNLWRNYDRDLRI